MFSQIAVVALGVYGFLLEVGGVIGFKKAGSRASLIAGSISGGTALLAAVLSVTLDPRLGFGLGLLLSALMAVFFGMRLIKSGKFMPAGLMAVASVIVLGITSAALFS